MAPSVADGDEVLVVPRPERLVLGEVVVVRREGGGFLLHRVIEVSERAVVTRGDACQRSDPPVGARDVLFRAVQARRRGRAGPIPRPGWRVALRRLRCGLTRLLAPLDVAPGRWWRARP
jgi:hypothetical protein